uniref:Anti-toxin MazE n=1 Tax=Bacillus phage KoopaTroopa TaxID=3234046 RepID=A0AB39C7H8_9CAUD
MNMNKQQLLDNVRQLNKGLAVLNMYNMNQFIGEELIRLGITKEDIELVTTHITDNFDAQELETILLQEAVTDYTSVMTKLLRHIKMAEGYVAMGDINKNITKEDFHLEDEVAKGEIVDGKVDSEETEGSTKEA